MLLSLLVPVLRLTACESAGDDAMAEGCEDEGGTGCTKRCAAATTGDIPTWLDNEGTASLPPAAAADDINGDGDNVIDEGNADAVVGTAPTLPWAAADERGNAATPFESASGEDSERRMDDSSALT